MQFRYAFFVFLLSACASGYDPLADYEPVKSEAVLDAPPPADTVRDSNESKSIARGAYLVELLGCGACHTDGALIGEPEGARALAGSGIGIAYTNPLQHRDPAVVFPKNLTPDDETGLGLWSADDIANAIKRGKDRSGYSHVPVMPSSGYAKLQSQDLIAIVTYLQSLEPVAHRVPPNVPSGVRTREPYVHFGVYRSRNAMKR